MNYRKLTIYGLYVLFVLLFATCSMDGGNDSFQPATISIAAIPGVTVPASGNIPVTVIAETDQYAGIVLWSPDVSGTFAASRVYTATIVLTAKQGYTLQGVAANYFTVDGAESVSNPANSGVVTAVFPPIGAGLAITVSIREILGVTIPVTGAIPAAAISATDQYTGTITWVPNGSAFVEGTSYTAIIDLAAKQDYTLEGVTANFFTVDGAAKVTNAANSGAVIAEFPATSNFPTPVLSDFQITGLPQQTYDGQVKEVVIKPLNGKSNGLITILYNGNVNSPPKNAGEYSITFSVAAAPGWNSANNINAGTLTVNPKALDVYGITAISREYDGTKTVALSSAGAVLVGRENNDDVSFSLGSDYGTIEDANAGYNKAVTINIQLTGTGRVNYTLTNPVITVDIYKVPGTTFPGYGPVSTTYTPTLTLYNLELPPGYKWEAPSTVLYAGANQPFKVKYAPNDNYEEADGIIIVNVEKANGAEVTISLKDKTNNSITINVAAPPSTGQNVKYAINTANTTPASGWQSGTTFDELDENTGYYIFARTTENDNYKTGAASNGLPVTTLAKPQNKIEYYWVDEHGDLVTTSGGQITVAPGETLTVSAQGSGYTVLQWNVNGVDTGQAGNTYVFSSLITGNHTVGLLAEKGGKLYNTNIVITVQ